MSENDPIPSKQTSSIPLKKETVRVTLKAADAPPAAPSAGISSAPTVRPPTPTAPPTPSARPTPTAPPVATGAPTAPGAPRPAPAPTIPLKTAPAAGIPRPAPTIALKTGPAVPSAPGTAPAARPALPGAPAAAPGASTVSLPKATVQLTPPSQPSVGIPTQKAATYTTVEDEETETADSPLAGILSGVGLIAALVVLYFQITTAGTWINAEDNPGKGQWFAELTK